LAHVRKDEIKKAADVIRTIKAKRDAIAHSTSGATETDVTVFGGRGASRVKMGTDKLYSVSQLNGWCDKLKANCRTIDEIITDITRWSWTRIEEDLHKWQQRLDERAAEIKASRPH